MTTGIPLLTPEDRHAKGSVLQMATGQLVASYAVIVRLREELGMEKLTTAEIMRAMTGGKPELEPAAEPTRDPLHGIPEAIGTSDDFPLTSRPGEYLAQPREPLPVPTIEPADQPMPTPNRYPAIQDLVMEDLARRKALGIIRYGTPLQPHNGRDALRDAYEEAMDLTQYLRQAIFERDEQ